MPEFLELLSPTEALSRLLENYHARPESETIETIHALDRVTYTNVIAPHPLPIFVRSTVDGYAVRAKDTFGASGSLPAYLKLAGEIYMGKSPDFDITPHQCALIHTGGMLPTSADAVVMVEHTQQVNDRDIEIVHSVAPNENIVEVGEDVIEGQVIIPPGKRLRPADIGGLFALGVIKVSVTRKPRIGIISSGDELIAPDELLSSGKVRDINSYSLSVLLEQMGCIPKRYEIVPDDLNVLQDIAYRALHESNMLVFTAGSSASARDLTAQVIDQLGPPGVLVHGVNIRPGKPTILAVCDGKPVIGLPGNPVSALVIADRMLRAVVDRLLGVKHPQPRPRIGAILSINLSSQSGREDWVPVRLVSSEGGYLAEPIFGKSNLIFTLSRADGMLCIPEDANGLSAGEFVDVYIF